MFQDGFDAGTVDAVGAQVDQNHVAVGSVCDKFVSVLLESDLERLGVLDNLFLVLTEFRGGGLLERDGQGSDGVVVRTTLVAREDGEVDGPLEIVENLLAGLRVGAADTLAEEDHGTTGSTEGLVGGGGDHISVLKGRRNNAGSNQTGNVSHIDNQVSANGVSDLAHASIVDQTAVGRGTGNKDLGAVHLSVGLQGVIVDDTSLGVDAVRECLEVRRDSRDLALGGLVSVTQVTAMRQVKTHQSIMRLHESLVNLQVGRTSRESLDIDTPLIGFETKCLQGTGLAGQFDGVDVLVTAVVASTGVSLGVFVGHWCTESIVDGARGDVLRGDEKDGLPLTLDFFFLDDSQSPLSNACQRNLTYDNLRNLRIKVRKVDFHQLYSC